jgi:hypothetical protein
MRYRKLQIAWSVVWGLAAVLLIALWVRSYWWWDEIQLGDGHRILVAELSSQYGMNGFFKPEPRSDWNGQISIVNTPVKPHAERIMPIYSFNLLNNGGEIIAWVPSWFAVVLASSLSAVPWIRWRFSLRTLLIATTLVAVALGLIVWAGR